MICGKSIKVTYAADHMYDSGLRCQLLKGHSGECSELSQEQEDELKVEYISIGAMLFGLNIGIEKPPEHSQHRFDLAKEKLNKALGPARTELIKETDLEQEDWITQGVKSAAEAYRYNRQRSIYILGTVFFMGITIGLIVATLVLKYL